MVAQVTRHQTPDTRHQTPDTRHQTPGSLLCPEVPPSVAYLVQPQPCDCHGLMILSRWPIISQDIAFFRSRIPWYQGLDSVYELFARRGALAASIRVSKVVGGVMR